MFRLTRGGSTTNVAGSKRCGLWNYRVLKAWEIWFFLFGRGTQGGGNSHLFVGLVTWNQNGGNHHENIFETFFFIFCGFI